jgi:hypothetical protein
VIAGPLGLLNRTVASSEVREYLDGLGRVEHDDQDGEVCLTFFDAGLSVIHESGTIHTVFLFLAAPDGFGVYGGPLPLGLGKEDSQADVRRKLGVPQYQRPAGSLKSFRLTGPIDRFDRPDFSVAVDYDEHGGRMRRLTLMLAVVVPRPPVDEPVH